MRCQNKRFLPQTIQMSKWLVIVKWICHVSVSHVVPTGKLSPTLQADTTFVFIQIVFILFYANDTSVDWYADQVPPTCLCLLPDTCWSLVVCQWCCQGGGGDVIHKYKKKNANEIANAVVFAYLCSDANYNYNLWCVLDAFAFKTHQTIIKQSLIILFM